MWFQSHRSRTAGDSDRRLGDEWGGVRPLCANAGPADWGPPLVKGRAGSVGGLKSTRVSDVKLAVQWKYQLYVGCLPDHLCVGWSENGGVGGGQSTGKGGHVCLYGWVWFCCCLKLELYLQSYFTIHKFVNLYGCAWVKGLCWWCDTYIYMAWYCVIACIVMINLLFSKQWNKVTCQNWPSPLLERKEILSSGR